ncbi:hypothetical protein H2200_000618 [Cladophialophora chaetospira]|uniref:Uncharacterized protein n=1 Tax=Cladophialophora chaetospira TaxID=386627 RepID=A0AA39CR48_9EURO|nr:hypothetical protein H2200_000618 [Cladophialophora chaetospira]
MVLSFITLAATVPLMVTSTIQLQDQAQNQKEGHELELKTEKCHLIARATKRMGAKRQNEFKDLVVVLHGGNLYLEPRITTEKHVLTGYLLPFPERSYDGIVSTINADNMLNWIFVKKDTYRLQYGVRAEAQEQLTGPVSLVSGQDEWRLAFNGWEGFVAVQKGDDWALYFDKDDNGLADRKTGKTVVEVELVRTAVKKPSNEDQAEDEPD